MLVNICKQLKRLKTIMKMIVFLKDALKLYQVMEKS